MDNDEEVNEVRILICPNPSESADCVGELVSLLHPKSGDSSTFFYLNGLLHEIHRFKEPYCSWFLGDYASKDGCLYSATPVDPVFIFLPLFHGARMKKVGDNGVFRSLEDILLVDGYPGYLNLFSVAEMAMQIVCEVREVESCMFFRLDDDKVLAWMRHKAKLLKEKLCEVDNNYAAQGEDKTLVDSVSILGEYLKEDPWLKLICADLVVDCVKASVPEDFSVSPQIGAPGGDVVEGRRKGNGTAKNSLKKAKVETTKSKNIKEMFSKASMSKI